MEAIIFIKNYFVWHYLWSLSDLFHNWLLVIRFVINYFSIPILLKTLFRPWRRMGEVRKGIFDFEFILIDMLMRFVGFVLRTAMIFLGFIATFLSIIIGPILFVFWVALPLFVLVFFWYGIKSFF